MNLLESIYTDVKNKLLNTSDKTIALIDLSSVGTKKKLSTIANILDNSYNSDSLIKMMAFVKTFLLNNGNLFINNRTYLILQSDLKGPKSSKSLFCMYFAHLLLNKDIFFKFLETLPKDVQLIFQYLTFKRQDNLGNIEKLLNIKTTIKSTIHYNYTTFDVPLAYHFFSPSSNFNTNLLVFTIKPYFAAYVQEFFPKPDDYYLTGIEKIPDNYLIFNDNNEIFTTINSLASYFTIPSNQYDMSKRITNSQASKICKIFNIKEFFDTDEKLINSLRSNMLIRFIHIKLLGKYNILKPQQDLLKEAIISLASRNSEFLRALFIFVTIGKAIDYSNDATFFTYYFNHFKNIKTNNWISFSNLFNSILYKNEHSLLIDYYASNRMYFTNDEGKIYVSENNYEKAVVYQSIKGLIFLLASLNVFEIAYKTPNLTNIGVSCYSPYDELAYFRLTPFGAYCLDISQEFVPQIAVKEQVYELDKDNLFIRLLDNAATNDEIILKEIGIKISHNRFKVTPESFMKSCDNEDKILDKIEFFEVFVDKNPPLVWKTFFKTIKNNINPLKKVNDMIIYKISEDNKNLINLIATNQTLRKMVTIAEGYKILVNKNDLLTFKTKLKELGYFMES